VVFPPRYLTLPVLMFEAPFTGHRGAVEFSDDRMCFLGPAEIAGINESVNGIYLPEGGGRRCSSSMMMKRAN
jgi:hypothetical protein